MSKSIDDIIAGFEPRQVSITFDQEDLHTLHRIMVASRVFDLDSSGIIGHICDELGVDLDPENGV